ncbi:50S ribosomal protein L22 [Candidatus Saccharibacteria bacterium]|nr:50S ribosomal protein L22 [Candidatus Saccharibacteria bacterium]
MKVKAVARNLDISAQKLRLSADLVRGAGVRVAMEALAAQPQKSAKVVYDAIHSAAANAQNNYNLSKTNLVIEEIRVDKGRKLKRYRPRARGSVSNIEHPSAHLTVIVADKPAAEVKKTDTKSVAKTKKETK